MLIKTIQAAFILLGMLLSARLEAQVVPQAKQPTPTLTMIKVEGGKMAMMGHIAVTVSSFEMSKTLITQEEYQKVMGTNPSHFPGKDLPVDSVSWYEAVAFCNRLSQLEGLTPAYITDGRTVSWNRLANGYRLPTEAEYEYAARGGNKPDKTTFAGSNSAADVAWYADNSAQTTHPVAQKKPNSLGLYDLSGNLYEWCWDWYDETLAGGEDPTGPSQGSLKVLRGGCWKSPPYMVGVAQRSNSFPYDNDPVLGFRVVRSLITAQPAPPPATLPTVTPPPKPQATAQHG